MKIFNHVSYNHDCSDDHIFFVTEEAYLKFYQSGNYDLVFSVNTFPDLKSSAKFKIKKEEYPFVHDLIKNMLNKIENHKILRGSNFIDPDYQLLYKDGYFSWQSDAPANELSKEGFVYNYLNILLDEDGSYILEFINNTNETNFCVEVNTDRSRYGSIRFDVWDFFNGLGEVVEKIDTHEKAIEIIRTHRKMDLSN